MIIYYTSNLQGSILLLKLFLTEGMTVCQNLFKLRTKEVSKVLKNLQTVTRYIQNICNHTKVSFILFLSSTYIGNIIILIIGIQLSMKSKAFQFAYTLLSDLLVISQKAFSRMFKNNDGGFKIHFL